MSLRAKRLTVASYPGQRRFRTVIIGTVVAACAALLGLYAYSGLYGINAVLRHGGTIWLTVKPDDARLSPSMRLALSESPPQAEPGKFEWQQIQDGFEAAELPVIAAGREADRLYLARVNPRRFSFTVRNAPAGDMELGDWMTSLGAALVINGSYFSLRGEPDTPLKSEGSLLGPKDYTAKHGAFVSSADFTAVLDLEKTGWPQAFGKARNAMISYPLLIRQADPVQITKSRWLANRSFVGQDRERCIIFGTTAGAFFTLHDLAAFLASAPLGLTLALNLDGGPVACQGISLAGFRRDVCGKWELAEERGRLKLLSWVFGSRRAALPVVLAVLRK